MSSIIDKRNKIDLINDELLRLLSLRQDILYEIMELKGHENSNSWDAKREKDVFQKMLTCKRYDYKSMELLSMIMEIQAYTANSKYPQWSQREHVESEVCGEFDSINPVLLMVINKPEYDKLKLKYEFKKILENI